MEKIWNPYWRVPWKFPENFHGKNMEKYGKHVMEQEDNAQTGKAKTSWIWKGGHFLPLVPLTEKKAKCAHCAKKETETILSYMHGTNSLANHLQKFHNVFPSTDNDSPKAKKKQKIEFPAQKQLEIELCVCLFFLHFLISEPFWLPNAIFHCCWSTKNHSNDS